MFEKNNVVFHTSAGICQIDDIRNENFTGDERLYYVMHPVNHNGRSVIYVPVDAKKSPIRSVLSEKEINQVIIDSKNEDIEWIDNNNLRKASFNEILHSDNISRIIAMIAILHRRKEKIMTNGKKMPVVDEKIMNDAEKKVHEEFSYVLSIEEEEVPGYIINQMANVY